MLAKTKAKTKLIIEMVVPVFGKNPKILPGFFGSGWLGFLGSG